MSIASVAVAITRKAHSAATTLHLAGLRMVVRDADRAVDRAIDRQHQAHSVMVAATNAYDDAYLLRMSASRAYGTVRTAAGIEAHNIGGAL